MTQPPPERTIGGNKPRGCSAGPRGREDHPLTDGHLAALLGGAEADLLAAISILALSGMRLAELRRLRVAQCGRGAFRDWAGECTDTPREIAEAALAHTVGNKVELAHRRGDALDKRRALMDAWADWCLGRGARAGNEVALAVRQVAS